MYLYRSEIISEVVETNTCFDKDPLKMNKGESTKITKCTLEQGEVTELEFRETINNKEYSKVIHLVNIYNIPETIVEQCINITIKDFNEVKNNGM